MDLMALHRFHSTFTVEINIPNDSVAKVQAYLEKNVSPRRYYLHNQIGGQNWAIKTIAGENIMCVNDKQLATYIALAIL